MIDLGIVKPGETIRIPFSSFDKDDGSSITMTAYAVADILVYKDGSDVERGSTTGYTATTDFDGRTGKHLAIIDLASNATASFFVAGSEYLVAIDAVTVDAVTTGGWIARFKIGYPSAILNTNIATLAGQTSFTLTDGPAEADAINGHWAIVHNIASKVQFARVLVDDYAVTTKTVTLVAAPTFTIAQFDNFSLMDISPHEIVDRNWDELQAGHVIADSFGLFLDTEVSGTDGFHLTGSADAGSTASTLVDAALLTQSVTDYWQHGILFMRTGVNAGQGRRITLFDTGTDTITVDPPFKTAIGTGDVYSISALGISDGLRPVTEGSEAVDVHAGVKKNTALSNYGFFMEDDTDDISGKTGLTFAAADSQRSIDGGAFANSTNVPTEIANGMYTVDISAADHNGDIIVWKWTGTGANPTFVTIKTQPI